MKIKIKEKKINRDAKLITSEIYKDNRGQFMELFNKKNFKKFFPKKTVFVQDNLSYSKRNVFRGFHYQIGKFKQSKLISVIKGEIDDYIVNINKKSKNYLKVYKISLSETVNACLWIPSNYAHGFFVKSKYAIVSYKTTSYYNPKYERGLNYKSNLLKLNFNSKVLVSKKDKLLPRKI